MIHSTEKLNYSPLSENKSNDLENKFIDELIEKLVNILNINYKDMTVVKSLFRTSLSSFLNSRSTKNLGLLQQYENAVLEKAIKRLKTELNVPEDIGVNFDYEPRDFLQEYHVKPDFKLIIDDETYYIEHLGIMKSQNYRERWFAKFKIYQKIGIENNLISTTEDAEKTGIEDNIRRIVDDIKSKNIKNTKGDYSLHHYRI